MIVVIATQTMISRVILEKLCADRRPTFMLHFLSSPRVRLRSQLSSLFHRQLLCRLSRWWSMRRWSARAPPTAAMRASARLLR